MTGSTEDFVCRALDAEEAIAGERIQSLWSGYGEIRRYSLRGARGFDASRSVIVKQVRPPDSTNGERGAGHPRGWSTDLGHQRKLESYCVEMAWYRDFAARCDDACRVAEAYALVERDGGWIFALEDLDAVGFGERCSSPRDIEVEACLRWLACFHARFLGVAPEGLWDVGSYWHLATRPGELAAMQNLELKAAAAEIDARLNRCAFKTLVHGDAKLANFCFSDDGSRVAAVDFQYVGAGCGIKDVAYFLSSCFGEAECEERAAGCVEFYLQCLAEAVDARGLNGSAVAAEWRALYPLAWADFVRFLNGWAPEHYKLHGYSLRRTREAIEMLRHGPGV